MPGNWRSSRFSKFTRSLNATTNHSLAHQAFTSSAAAAVARVLMYKFFSWQLSFFHRLRHLQFLTWGSGSILGYVTIKVNEVCYEKKNYFTKASLHGSLLLLTESTIFLTVLMYCRKKDLDWVMSACITCFSQRSQPILLRTRLCVQSSCFLLYSLH